MATSLQDHSTLLAKAIAIGSVLVLVVMATAAVADDTVVVRIDGAAASPVLGNAQSEVRLEAGSASTPVQLVDTESASRPATVIDFAIDTAQDLRIEVLDLDGELVRTLASGLWAQGEHRMAWHHDDDEGRELADGVYVVRLIGQRGTGTLALAR